MSVDADNRSRPTPAGGVVPPVVTPLTTDGDLDRRSLERLIGHLLGGGVDGLFALGSTSEIAFFDDEMRAKVLDATVGIVAGQVPILCGVIDTQTNRVISHVRKAESAGVAGVVATAPFYAITGPGEIDRHFRAIAAAATTPLWAYDIPVCVHTKLGVDQLLTLGQDGVLAGVKDSSGDDVSFRRLTASNAAAGSPLSIFTGHEVVVDGAYLAGADGAVPGLGNVDPASYVRMDRAARAGDWETVRKEQDRLAALFEIVFVPTEEVGPAAGVGAFKTALQVMGLFDTNTMSLPMQALGGQDRERIRAIVEAAGLC